MCKRTWLGPAAFVMFTASASAGTSSAELPPASQALLYTTFQDHAVLQRNTPIPLWGVTKPGAHVTISLAGEHATATADSSGKWHATLPPLKAGGPYELEAHSSTGERETLNDIAVGDVYLCSGQSNMEWPVIMAMHGASDAAAATNPNIRLFTVHRYYTPTPSHTFGAAASWVVATPDTVKDFSAVCYFFGRDLQPKVGVPIGLIYSAWGGSPIQAWMSAHALAKQGPYAEQLRLLQLYATSPAEAEKKWREATDAWWQAHDPATSAATPWRDPAYDDSAWPQAIPTGSWKDWGAPALSDFDGIIWFRKTVALTAAQAAGPAVLTLGPIDQADKTWVNGIEVGGAEGWDVDRVYTIPAGTLHQGSNLIAVGVLGGDGPYGAATQRTLKLADGSVVKLDTPWRYHVSAPASHTGPMPHTPWQRELGLSTLYNGMIAPLGPTPVRAVVWYQGESNTDDPSHYQALLSGLIAQWRQQFGEVPFLIVQLPGYGPASAVPEKDSAWAEVREAQRQVTDTTPQTGMAVIIDLGDRANLHPVVKQEVGRRLMLLAQRMLYGEDVVDSGPDPVSAIRRGGAVDVRFTDLAKGMVTYGSNDVIGFQLCGTNSDCRFARADVAGDLVRVAVPRGLHAAKVRFCWGGSPICNLYNTADLPAVPFEMPVTAPKRTADRGRHAVR